METATRISQQNSNSVSNSAEETTDSFHSIPAIGKIEVFDNAVEEWEDYLERIECYFEANGIKDDQKVNCLIATMGASTYALLKSLTAPDKPRTKSFAEITGILKKHLNPAPIVIAERFRFYMRNQKPSESVTEYVAAIKSCLRIVNLEHFWMMHFGIKWCAD